MAAKRDLYRWLYDNIHCHFYDSVTRWCFVPLGGENKVRQNLLDVVGLREGDRVLDMCCGTGSTTSIIAARVGGDTPVRAIDLSSGQVRVARRKHLPANIEFMVMDASSTGFPECQFDHVVIPHALHEMTRSVRLAVLEEARRVVGEGGSVAALEMDTATSLFRRLWIGLWWFYWLPFNPETSTRKDMLKHGLEEEFGQAGFHQVTRTRLFGGALQVVRGVK